jgi:hypothetical protein
MSHLLYIFYSRQKYWHHERYLEKYNGWPIRRKRLLIEFVLCNTFLIKLLYARILGSSGATRGSSSLPSPTICIAAERAVFFCAPGMFDI